MARFTIYSKDGQIRRHEGEPQYSGSYMGVDFVEFRTISSPTPIDWQIGDYVDYYRTGKRYKLYSLPMPKKVARKGEYGAYFEYSNVQLHGATKELEIAPFRDLVTKDNKIHFSTRPEVSTYEDVYGIARRIQECMNDLYPNKWRIEVYDTDDDNLLSLLGETKEYSVSNGSCLDALSQIYDTWKNVGWIHTYDSINSVDVITIGRANVRDLENTSDAFAYGIGKGLTSIKKASANNGEFATRLYIYGSERNIQTRYYNGLNILNKDSVDIRNLMLPIEKWGKTDGLPDASKAYLQADDSIIEKYGLIPRTVYFDGTDNEEIYPSIKGLTMVQVRQAMIAAGEEDSEYLPTAHIHRIDKIEESYSSSFDDGSKEQTEKNMTFHLGLYQMGFNIADQGKLTSEGFATISMKSGACAGRDFKVRRYADITYEKVDGSKCLVYEVERNWDESLGMGFPNKTYPINDGDEFVLLDIPMPGFYIDLAEDSLFDAGEKMLADYTKVSAFYEPSVDAIKIKAGSKLLQAGMFMQVYDEDIIDTADNKDYVLIDTLTIDEKSDLPIYKVTLREQKRSARTYSALEDMIEDAKEVSRQDIRRERQYTDRRFRSAQQSLELLQAAFRNFSEGINPVTVRTMAMLVGDESLQFKFTASRNSLTDIACPFSYDEKTKQVKSAFSYLKHMTLGIKTVTTGTMPASSYKTWSIPIWASAVLDDGAKSYYVYVKASKSDSTSECLLSETPIGMEDVSGYYHFLVGILNSEYDGKRDFITLYGFTEVLPGQITTDVLRSANSNLIIDLLNAKISAKNGATIEGKMIFQSGSSGLENLSEWSEKQQEIDNANENSSAAKAATEILDTKISDIETGVNESVAEINARLDGVVENYFEEGAPALDKKPVTDWIDASEDDDYELINHVGDTYTNIEEYVDDETTPDAGKSWRWCWCDDSSITDKIEVTDKEGVTRYLHWHPIADSDAVKALLEAYKAQTTADGKSRIFVNQPTPPYKEGDLWVQGESGEIMRCKNGINRTSGSYDASDWELASKYTDDTKANEAKYAAENAKAIAQNTKLFADALNSDTVLTEVEKREIRRLMSEITECTDASVTEYNARVVRSAVSGNEWYLVNDKSYAEWYDEDSDEDVKVSQKAWAGYYSSDMHTNGGTTVTRLNLTVYKSLNLKVKFGSDAESSYDYLNVGALDASVVATADKHSLTDPTMQASTKGRQGITNAMTKTFAFDGKSSSHYIELSYKKDSSDYSGTDSGYYRLMNESYMGADGNEYIVEMNGSFHRYYLTLMRNGYTSEATELKTRLNNLMSFLSSKELWESGSSTIDETFRTSLNDLVAKYYAYVAEIGFDIAMDRINDAEYLTNAMKNGRTIIDGGLVMSSMVAVADTESASDADVEAFLNGSDFASDTTHGKLILAGGIPESVDIDGVTSTDLKERAKQAKTRIYEDGTEYTHKLVLSDGCKIGDDLIIETIKEQIEGGDTEWEDDNVFIESAIIKSTQYDNSYGASFSKAGVRTFGKTYSGRATTCDITNSCSGYAAFFGISDTAIPYQYCLMRDKPVAIEIDAPDAYAISISRGQISGLRPKTRVITTLNSNILTDLDHSVFVNLTSGTCYIYLPENPQDGQEYYIESRGATMSIKMYQQGYSLYSGNTAAAGYSVTQTGRALLRFKYYAEASLWVYSWLNRNS